MKLYYADLRATLYTDRMFKNNLDITYDVNPNGDQTEGKTARNKFIIEVAYNLRHILKRFLRCSFASQHVCINFYYLFLSHYIREFPVTLQRIVCYFFIFIFFSQ